MGHLVLDEEPLVFFDVDIEAVARDQATAALQWVFAVVTQRHGHECLTAARQVEARRPAQYFFRVRQRREQALTQGLPLLTSRNAMEATELDADRMHRASAEQLDARIADTLQHETAPHLVGILRGHRGDAVVAEQLGQGQHVDVQTVALYPFAAIHHAPQREQPRRRRKTADGFARLHRAHLIGDGAAAADTRYEVGHLGAVAPEQQLFEITRRLVDAQLQRLDHAVADVQIERALALHTRERRHLYFDFAAVSHAAPPPAKRGRPG